MQNILHELKTSTSRIYFIERILNVLFDKFNCDFVELRVCEKNKYYLCDVKRGRTPLFSSELLSYADGLETKRIPAQEDSEIIEELIRVVFTGEVDGISSYISSNGSFWINDTADTAVASELFDYFQYSDLTGIKNFRSIAIIPFSNEERTIGLLRISCKAENFFTADSILQFEAITDLVATALSHQRATAALQERVKELSCIYDINEIVRQSELSLDELFVQIADAITHAWRYPEIASGRIDLDGNAYLSKYYNDGPSRISAPILVNKVQRGEVEVVYSEKRPDRDEGPFLFEERKLIEAIAQKISTVIIDIEAKREKEQLKDQLHHADRLATIGQLASGIAHEINEPLAGILGFSQLLAKDESLSLQAKKDLGKITSAALHTREIVKKLLLFSRQMPSQKSWMNLNTVILDALSILEGHIKKASIELVKCLQPNITKISADPSQISQVIINLTVNAIQAMPDGGTLTIESVGSENGISIILSDTGIGMSEKTKSKLFTPFFTTKDVDEGTGLGLPVVHGIVSAHGGTIDVESEPGKGARFVIHLPSGENANE